MSKAPRISEAEWRVMRVLWLRAPRTANEVVEALEGENDWSPKTVKTLLNRLVNKGALRYEQQGRAYLYSPAIEEAECVRAETESFLERVFGGGLKPLLAHFLEREEISREEIAELRALLEQKKKAPKS